jgi:hypothetical protein
VISRPGLDSGNSLNVCRMKSKQLKTEMFRQPFLSLKTSPRGIAKNAMPLPS